MCLNALVKSARGNINTSYQVHAMRRSTSQDCFFQKEATWVYSRHYFSQIAIINQMLEILHQETEQHTIKNNLINGIITYLLYTSRVMLRAPPGAVMTHAMIHALYIFK